MKIRKPLSANRGQMVQNLNMYYKTYSKFLKLRINFIPLGTVDNNLGLDRLAGPKALDPNYC